MTIDEAAVREFEEGVRGVLIRPGDAEYDSARQVHNAMIDRKPALIARCAGVGDVIDAIRFARAADLPVAVRAGGHNVTGRAVCNDGIVIDLGAMRGIRIDPSARTVRVEAGLTWGEVNHDLQHFGLAAAGGFVSTTGVAGLTLGGGLGWLVRKHGLACDNLLSADMVTADGRFLTASGEENEDLFWALRGGGGNFGVVTSFEFRVHPVGTALAGLLVHPIARAPEVLRFWRDYAAQAPEELTDGFLLFTAPPAPFIPEATRGAPVVGVYAVYAGDPGRGESVLRPLREFGPPVADIIQPMPYSAAQTMADWMWPRGLWNYWKSGFLAGLGDEAIDAIVEGFATAPSPMTTALVEHNGDGALNRVAPDATAFGHRDWSFNFLATSLWPNPADTDANIAWTRAYWDAVRPFTTGGVYINYLGAEGEDRVRAAYGADYDRLVAVKDAYDPENVFRLNQNIAPTGRAAAA
ncbi:FAD-binding oxidoreductase [Kitasatospora sp. KL5]|uniref:FAD-binding oxidoreductase n=1 Tax=Kitasatospora sp. KL5 TaxID=3425125 RepID=UPI003D6E5869